MKKIIVLFFFIFLITQHCVAQIKDSIINTPLLIFSYAVQQPGGDMAKRFGWNSSLGGSFLFKNNSNWIGGLSGNFIFGNNIHEPDLLVNITTHDGYIIGADGHYADVRFYERGFNFAVDFGKIIPKLSPNPNCGFLILSSVGFLQHKIRIEDISNTVPGLRDNYIKGYDRLTNGISLTEFIGYIYLSNNKLINFYGGLEFIQAWTENRRTINFDTMNHDGTKRHDYLTGLRLGWILPLYKRNINQFYYN